MDIPPEHLRPTDPLARYLLQRTHFSPAVSRVKPGAFMPNRDGETSVFQIQGLSEEEIWQIGEKYVSSPLGKTLRARADVIVLIVEERGLRVDFDNTPPRHANIVGWPEEKSAQKLIALELSSRAALKINL